MQIEPRVNVSSRTSAVGQPDDRWPRMTDVRTRPSVRGDRVFSWIDRFFLYLNRIMRRAVPREHNPFAQLGAVANLTFLIALVSGVLLLVWYRPSVHEAYASVEAMGRSWSLAGFMRALHRYSSDACMLFVLLHGLQTLGARKFGGARWLGWMSGLLLIGLLWLDGWTGYWLVWDERAQLVAVATATMLDVLPIFPEPLMRSFLTNESVNSLLFFLVFFVHMLIPLAMGVLLWIHIMRLSKPKFLTGPWLSGVILVILVALSLAAPVASEGPADLLSPPDDVTADWYYMLPAFFVERIQGGIVWLIALTGGVALFSLPWLLTRDTVVPARVDPGRCNGCTLCYEDCPFNAIDMVTVFDERRGAERTVAEIDPALCVGCGVCVGSCDPAGISYSLDPLDVRKLVNRVSATPPASTSSAGGDGAPGMLGPSVDVSVEEGSFVAFVCADSAGGALDIADDGSCSDLPGYRVIPVPCIAWVHMLLVERAFRRRAAGVLLVGCDADPSCRIGADWTGARLKGDRAPALRRQKIPEERVRFVRADVGDRSAVSNEAASFRAGRLQNVSAPARLRTLLTTVAAAVLIAAATFVGSDAPLPVGGTDAPTLVVSFKHAGRLVEAEGANEQTGDVLPHMRRTGRIQNVERRRAPARLRVRIDGRTVLEKTYPPSGLFNDGASVAIERLSVSPGQHDISVAIGDGRDLDWSFSEERSLEFSPSGRRVVLFDRVSGFSWHQSGETSYREASNR